MALLLENKRRNTEKDKTIGTEGYPAAFGDLEAAKPREIKRFVKEAPGPQGEEGSWRALGCLYYLHNLIM